MEQTIYGIQEKPPPGKTVGRIVKVTKKEFDLSLRKNAQKESLLGVKK